jgi:Zn2+/Cd2+-exporting ATPase
LPCLVATAAQVGLNDARGELLPEDKLQVIKSLRPAGPAVGMVGNGLRLLRK